MTNLHAASTEPVLDHKDILELTQFVRNFTEALYKLKEVFNFTNKTGEFIWSLFSKKTMVKSDEDVDFCVCIEWFIV